MLFLRYLVFQFGMMMDKLECIKVFRHVARLESFTATAIELNTTQGAVSKKIAWLEGDLGFTLFHRNSRKISLTSAGKQYLGFCHELVEKMTLTEQLINKQLSLAVGTLKISAPSAFATQRLAVPIRKFLIANPEVKIDISVDDKHADLYRDDIDIAIRASYLKDSGLKAKKLLDHDVCYFASPDYLKNNGTPVVPEELSKHTCLTYSLSTTSNVWQINKKKFMVRELFTSDSPEMLVKMAILGCGIAAMPKWMVQESFKMNQLTELFADHQKGSLPMYAVYKNSDYLPYRIRAFVDFIASYFESELVN